MHNDTTAATRERQRRWARTQGLTFSPSDYLETVEANLRLPLSTAARAAFERGDGQELTGKDGALPKMRSLISSSALAVNVFGHWDGHPDLSPLVTALGLRAATGSLAFEQRLPIDPRWTPPNVDVVITTDAGTRIGIESKFTEWTKPTTCMPQSVAPYLTEARDHWARAGLPQADRLARAIRSGAESYQYLHVPQLLKHGLGLALEAKASGAPWVLRYVYYAAAGPVADEHAEEIARFTAAVGEEFGFAAITYQALVQTLAANVAVDREYLRYLDDRYVS
jgi:hypothetical protein